jgi:acyl-CoA reductase-like NAD-dependent aldehyde dehydrogenase
MKKRILIGGEWRETASYNALYAPYSREMLADIPDAAADDVEQAILAAVRCKSVMKKMPSHQRAAILEKVAVLLQERREEAARLIAMEAAKPLKAAYGEVDRTVQTYKFAAEEAKRIHGETVPLDAAIGGERRIAYTSREPVGVVGAITPFNFPMNLVAHKLGPAFAAGNTVVMKPAPQTPLSAFFTAELFVEAGLPAGALNVITGDGKLIGNMIVTDPRVNAITFTGSSSVGSAIHANAGLKRVTLELGSNSAVIIDRDADLEAIIPRCVTGAFANQGQVCISLQRIYVVEERYQEFVDRFIAATKKLRIGDPLDTNTDVSALISEREAQRVREWIEEAVKQGATLALGGKVNGSILEPAVLLGVPSDARISCMEVFAPVVIINKVQHIEEAIELVNDSKYGLQAGIFTNNLAKALFAAEELQVGGVLINDIPTFRVDHMPYGGIKESGLGREGIKYAIEDLTELKLVVFTR